MQVIRGVGDAGCLEEPYLHALKNVDALVVDPVSSAANVAFSMKLDGKAVLNQLDQESRDLVDIGTAVYVADETLERKVSPDTWTRSFDVLAPIARPEHWRRATPALVETLQFLSGDRWSFDWRQCQQLPPVRRHRAVLPEGIDAVCLFSGGVDSLLGADLLLAQGKRVLLVGHHAEGATAGAQTRLARTLRVRYPGQVWLLQAGVRGGQREQPEYPLSKPREDTHRVRSFLFLALGVALARTLKVSQVFIPENGLIAINAPTQISRVGSCSTRTAHPRYLLALRRFLRECGLYQGEVRNPFLYMSKTDMVVGARPELHSLLIGSTSCARPNRYKNLGVRHCGYCVPCIYRRIAFGAADLDDGKDYAFRVFEDPVHIRDKKGVDLRALARFASTVVRASPSRRDRIVLSHGFFPPSAGGELGPESTETYAPWSEMLSRWATGFEQASARFHPEVRRALGISLTRRVKG